MERWHYADVTAARYRTEPSAHETLRRSFRQAISSLAIKTIKLFFARNDVRSSTAVFDNHQKILNKTMQYATVGSET
jgi:hypothetical protein